MNINQTKQVMQGDGNLVLYDANGTPTWNTQTSGVGIGPWEVVMQTDGNLVLYATNGYSWASNTSGQK
jgi:hypothetical protein